MLWFSEENNSEFLTAVAPERFTVISRVDAVHAPQLTLHAACELAEYLVANEMAVAIIDALEMIEIKQQHRESMTGTIGT